MAQKTRVLLAKLGLDVHSRGVLTVARELRDAGMEVIYVGNALPGDILKIAVQEDAEVVGVSSLGGAHLTLGGELMEEARRERLTETMAFLIGGVFSAADGTKLEGMGFNGTFVPGATREQIVSSIRSIVSYRRSRESCER